MATSRAPAAAAQAVAAFRARNHYPALDGLRALSILLVLVWHVDTNRWWWLSGYTGVNIFFVLSGFLIHSLLLREERVRRTISLVAFYLRRIFRILPLYLTMICAYLLLLRLPVLEAQQQSFLRALPYYLTAMNDFAPLAPFNQSWSLGVEEKFYFLAPLLFFVLLPRKRRSLMLLLITLPMLAAIHLHIGWVAPYGMILVGCMLAELLDDPHAHQVVVCQRWLGPVAFCCWIGCHLLLSLYPDRSTLLFGYVLFGYVLSVALAMAALLTRPTQLGRLLSHPVAVWLGRRSYAIYLVHLLVLSVGERLLIRSGYDRHALHDWALVLLTLSGSILSAELLCRLIEQPALHFGRRLARHWQDAHPG